MMFKDITMTIFKRSVLTLLLALSFHLPVFSQQRGDMSNAEAMDMLKSMGMVVFDEQIPAPDFNLISLRGGRIQLSDYRGKVVFLNFWATWCGPCRAEMPSMQDLYADLQDENFVVLAINQQEGNRVVQDFVDQQGFSFPVLMDNGQVSYQYGVRGIPTTFIIGPDGNVIAGKVGTHLYEGETYRRLFRALM